MEVQKVVITLVRYTWVCDKCGETHFSIQTPEEEFSPSCLKEDN